MMRNLIIAALVSSVITVLWLRWFWAVMQKRLSEQNEELTRLLTEFVEKYVDKVLTGKRR